MSELLPEFTAFADASRSDIGRLSAFRARALRRHLEYGRHMTPYWLLEPDQPDANAPAIVFFPGANGHGEIWFPYMLALAKTHRCVAISLPPCKNYDDLNAFLGRVLEECGIKAALFVGTSVGGYAAQVFARAYPERCLGLALCLTGTASAQLPAEVRARWIARGKRRLRMAFQPFGPMFRATIARQAYVSFCPERHYDSMVFWREYLVDTFKNYIYKKQYVAIHTDLVPGFYRQYRHEPADLTGWNRPVLILEAPDDPTYGEAERAALRALYPQATAITLPEGGQFGLYLHETEVVHALEAWANA